MLLRHSLHYGLARGVPGLLSLAGVALYTRLLTPDEFGLYVVVLACVGVADVVLFQWLKLVLARFLPGEGGRPEAMLGGVAAQFLTLALGVLAACIVTLPLWGQASWRALMIAGAMLLLTQAWFDLNLGLASAQLQTGRYARLSAMKSVVSLATGTWLALSGFGAQGPLLGLLAGHVVATVVFGRTAWRHVSVQWPPSAVLSRHLGYGLPLTATFALGAVVASSDRILLSWFLGASAAGAYAAGYDLGAQSIGLLLAIVNTAAYPLAVHALERDGVAAARVQLALNGSLVASLSCASAAGLVLLAPAIVAVVIGPDLREGATVVLPWIAIAVALAGVKAFHFDIAFHLARRSQWLLVTTAAAAALNVVLNVLLIPAFGPRGAAWATVASFAVAATSSAVLGRRVFAMPAVLPITARAGSVALATAVGVMVWAPPGPAPLSLAAHIGAGAACAAAAAVALDVGGVRKGLLRRWTLHRNRRAVNGPAD